MRFAWTLPAAAAVTALAFAIAPIAATPAYAVTPPGLVAEPIAQNANQVLTASISRLRDAPARTATRDAEVVRWVLRDDGKDDPVIAPEWQHWVWNDDGTGRLESTAGAPYSVTADGRIVDPVGDAPAAGTAVESKQPYRYGYFPKAPPADAAQLSTYLQEATSLKPDADGLAVWGSLSALRDEWILSPAQQAAALELLQDARGISVLGTVTDRFGRAGIALKITSEDRPQFAATLVLAASTREIIAADIVYLGGSKRLDLPANSVIEYSAWLSR
ncbi:hypothetical protein [Microbacterium sp.]|uniref:hypothetical protein n=1 Tax=Microbacterium sp. TaxID=51671 RepID=UPI003A8FFE6A